MFTDPGMTHLATGFTFIADNNVSTPTSGNAYTMNSTTAVVGAFTGTNCNV